MRYLWFILVLSILSSAGCAALINGSGKDLREIATKDQIHQVFGTPKVAGMSDGESFEEFHTHRKLSERWKGEYFLFADIMTLGLGELIMFPRELYRAGREIIVGQTLRFTYDEAGNVTHVFRNGTPYSVLGWPEIAATKNREAAQPEIHKLNNPNPSP